MKKVLALVLSLAMLTISLTACSSTSAPSAPTSGGSLAPGSAADPNGGLPASWPKGTITYKCGYAAGGTQDLVARSLAQYAEAITGNSYYVENITGGSGLIMINDVYDREADGTNACIYSCTIPTAEDLQYFPTELLDALMKANVQISNQMEPVAQVNVDYSAIFIRADEGRFTTFAELGEYIKAHPGELAFGATGASGNGGLMMQTFINKFGWDISPVYYDSTPENKAAMLNGEIDVMCATIAWMPSSGDDFTCLGYSAETSDQKSYPGVATFKEQGYDFMATMRRGMFVKKGTDQAIIDYMEKMYADICSNENYIADQTALNYTVDYAGAAELRTAITEVVDTYNSMK